MQTPPIAIPSGSNFPSWNNKKFFIDKTEQIIRIKGALEKGSAIFFGRPRRWGKSLFMSTIKHFFDFRYFKSEYFEDKKIWEDEEMRKKAGKYLVISLDLKPVYNRDTVSIDFEGLFFQLTSEVSEVLDFETEKIDFFHTLLELKEKNYQFGKILIYLIKYLSKKHNIYLLIDEYDKPVNDCLKSKKNEHTAKEILEDLKDQFYRYLKDAPCITLITGVNKLSMASFFSDFNNLMDYSNSINLGFTEQEVQDMYARVGVEYEEEIKKWYNGYYYGGNYEFNPWATVNYIRERNFEPIWSNTGTSPVYFEYLIQEILEVKNIQEYENLLKDFKYDKSPVHLDFIENQDKSVVLHYFYYAGLLSVDTEDNFFIPNNDVVKSYERFLIKDKKKTRFQIELKSKLIDFLEKIDSDLSYFENFMQFMITAKYNNLDKPTLSEMNIVSDVFLLVMTFSRLDLRRETNIFEGRTDLEFIDYTDSRVLIEFKLAKNSAEIPEKIEEAKNQLKKYNAENRYERLIYCIVEKETGETRCGKI